MRRNDYVITTIFAAHGDGGERGVGPVLSYHSTTELAKVAAAKQGWYGGDGAVLTVAAINVSGLTFALADPFAIQLDMTADQIAEKHRELVGDRRLHLMGDLQSPEGNVRVAP